MQSRCKFYICVLNFLFIPMTLGGQSTDDGSMVPRTNSGHPNFNGIWANNSATPLERPAELANKESFTDEELSALQDAAVRLFGGAGDAAFADGVFLAALAATEDFTSRDSGTGNYSSVWMVGRDFDARTSLITSPTNGQLPTLTNAANERQIAASKA